MAQNRPFTSAAQNFFTQFNAGQNQRRLDEREDQRRQAILEAAALKREQELADRENLALSIENTIGIDTGGVQASAGVQPVEDSGIFPSPQTTPERRGPGRQAGFTFNSNQRKAFSQAVAINPSVSAPILNFLTKANDFQLQEEANRTARNLRGAVFLQDQVKKSPVLFQQGIKQLVESGIYGPNEVQELVQLSNETNPDLVNLKLEKLVLDNTPKKTILEEEVQKRKEARVVQPGFTLSQGQQRFDAQGRPIAVVPGAPSAQFEDVLGPDGKIIAQKNLRTGEVKKSPLATGGEAEKGTFTRGPGAIVERPEGGFAIAVPVVDTRTGKGTTEFFDLEGRPLSKLGETGEELTARRIRETRGKTLTKSQITRLSTDINDGISAAKGMAVVNRSIKLLDDLETGGFDAIKVRIKQTLGVESANEAELTANLGKQVLAQLRPIFGSQFTEREGATLTRIEAGFGKSTKGNIRLLNQIKQLIQRAAKRGIAAAKDTDDFRSALDIQDLLEFTLQDVAPETITDAGGVPSPANQPAAQPQRNIEVDF